MAGALGASLTAGACATASSGVNRPRVQLRASIETALSERRLDDAVGEAAAYERRVPGPESWNLLGRALWRSGDLTAAEGLFRRAATAGSPDGRVGLAMTAAARGRLDEAWRLATEAAAAPEARMQASSLLATIAWHRGAIREVGDRLRDAALGAMAPAVRRRLLDAAAAADRVAALSPSQAGRGPVSWRGAPTRMLLRPGLDLQIEAVIGETPATLRLALGAGRSTVTPEFVRRADLALVGGEADGGWTVAPLGLGTLRADAVALAVRDAGDPESGVDGVLAFDVLSTLRWILWASDGALALAAPGPAAPADWEDRPLDRTHWAGIRTPIELLDMQLLLMPRLAATVIPAALDPGSSDALGRAAHARAAVHGPDLPAFEPGRILAVEVRVGGWRGDVDMRLADLPHATGQAVSPPARLGAGFARRWGIGWLPRERQLLLFEAPPAAGR